MKRLCPDRRGNSLNRLAGVPKREQEKMRLASLHPTQDVYPPISCCRLVVGNPGCMQVVKLRIGLGCHRDSLPSSCDHASSLHMCAEPVSLGCLTLPGSIGVALVSDTALLP
jgi:hypothetical protein